jgi:hypothetical protein
MLEKELPEILEAHHAPAIVLREDNTTFELIVNNTIDGIKKIMAPSGIDLKKLKVFFDTNYKNKNKLLLPNDEIIRWIVSNGGHTLTIPREKLDAAKEFHRKNVQTLIFNNVAGLMLGMITAGVFYTERKPFSRLLMAPADAEVQSMAEKFLWIGMISSMPDAIRIVSLGALRSWKDVLLPTAACLAMMTAVGVPLGNTISHEENDWSYMLITRNAVIALSSVMMVLRCAQKIKEDKQVLSSQLGHSFPLSSQEDVSSQEQRGDNSILRFLPCFSSMRERSSHSMKAPLMEINSEVLVRENTINRQHGSRCSIM